MEKLGLLAIPLMAISLLASCAKGNDSMQTTVTFSKESVGCALWYNDVSYAKGARFKIPAGVDVTLTVEANQDYLPVFKDGLTISEAMTYNFNPNKKEITVKVASNGKCVIKAIAETPKENLEAYKWSEISQLSEMGLADDLFKVGDIKKVTVNEKDHDVRIIGFNHDALKSDKTKTAGITFEFANVITKSNGDADTTYWNNESASTNYKYSKSTLNDYLNKDSNCIFNKLPDELKADGIIKEVYKPVAEGSSYEINETYTTKLFPLSYREITASGDTEFVKDEGFTYPFYTGEDYDTDDNRIKKEVGSEVNDFGESYWLRSPAIGENLSSDAWYVGYGGGLSPGGIYVLLYMVAPAFCI